MSRNPPLRQHRARITFIYLGRSPSFSSFVLDLSAAAARNTDLVAEYIVADHTRLADGLEAAGADICRVPTFGKTTAGWVLFGYPRARHRILERLAASRPDAVVTLLPHVWSPLLTPQIRRLGIRYATIIHDADPHPGDPTAWLTPWLARDANAADMAIALSGTVADRLSQRKLPKTTQIARLFHPDLRLQTGTGARQLGPDRPLRILFFGRILGYKGLPVLVEAVEQLRREGVAVELGIAGEGPLHDLSGRLEALGAEVINRWLSPEELGPLLARYDVMGCSHVEASQSGVAALAFGHCMPVIATPIGGLAEQVVTGKTGILSDDLTAAGFAAAVRRLATEPGLYATISRTICETATDRSMDRFVSDLLALMSTLDISGGVAKGS